MSNLFEAFRLPTTNRRSMYKQQFYAMDYDRQRRMREMSHPALHFHVKPQNQFSKFFENQNFQQQESTIHTLD